MKKLTTDELHRVSTAQFKEQHKNPVTVVLDNIRSMYNVGSVFRTCDAFNAEKLYLCGITACPPHKEINKTALGATESVDWEHVEDAAALLLQLKHSGYQIFAVEQVDEARELHHFDFPAAGRIALVLGNEVFGVDERLLPLCDGAVEIPQFGTKHSLNVSVAAGIVLWEAVKPYIR